MQWFLIFTLFVCFAAVLVQSEWAADEIEDISGAWIIVEQFYDKTRVHRAILEVTDSIVTVRIGNAKLKGVFENSALSFSKLAPDGQQAEIMYTGKLRNGSFVGEGTMGAIKLKWRAHRPPEPPLGGPRSHVFTPTEFHRVFSSTTPPALHIFPGDTVKTTSVDAAGMDENSKRRSWYGNPMTGPFYIEGAIPGDTLVVRFDCIRINRDWAISGRSIIGKALTPGYLMSLNHTNDFNSRWKLDEVKGVAYLEKPTDLLKGLTLPLQPMIGCIAVAPQGQEVRNSRSSGNYGGNMDYLRIREGATVYLPVFHMGALLLIGDGHAAQGDGEITGDALETSMEFEFTVDIIKEKSIGMPRAEDAEYLMAIGIGDSLEGALQRATTEMVRWLEDDYKLNSNESAMALGFVVKYDIASFAGTPVIVAKLPKNTVAQLNRS